MIQNKKREKEKNMKKIQKIAAAALALTMIFGAAGCGSGGSAKGEAKNIVIGISPDYPPYDDLTTSGELTGFDYDMGEWLFNWMSENGYSYTHEWKQLSFDTIISAIQADQVDLGISGFTYDKDRKVLFSDTYLTSGEVALVTADSDIAALDDLKGKKIGAQLGTTGEQCANEVEGADVHAESDMGILVESLKGGALDAVIMDEAVGENYEATGNFKVVDGKLLDEDNYIIAKEGNTELMDAVNKALAAFKESDDYAKLKEKYGL